MINKHIKYLIITLYIIASSLLIAGVFYLLEMGVTEMYRIEHPFYSPDTKELCFSEKELKAHFNFIIQSAEIMIICCIAIIIGLIVIHSLLLKNKK